MKQRQLRVAEAVKAEIGSLLLTELKDPRIAFTSVTEVEVSGDLSRVTIYFSVLGDDAAKEQTLKGLLSSKGVMRRAIGRRLQLRLTPEVEIQLDNSIEHGARILELIEKEVTAKEPSEVSKE